MERIVIVIGPSGVERTALDFACYLISVTGSKLTGLFLHEELANDPPDDNGWHLCHNVKDNLLLPKMMEVNIEDNKRDFKRFCENHNLRWSPDIRDGENINDAIIESRFSDLLIVSADLSFSRGAESIPTNTVSTILKNSECPVIIAPLSFSTIREIVFCYDGSESSVFAIKEFTHLFPQFEDTRITFLEVNQDFSSEVNHKEMITNYLKMHYSVIGYQVLKGLPENELFSYFLNKKDVFIVMGAFGKKFIPSIFIRSTANLLLRTTSLPVFISHK
jgi:hypothetical protein